MKLITIGLLCSSLTACFEVEDDSNDDVVAALEEQNSLLQEQQNNAKQPITIFGKVVNTGEPSSSVDATITVKVGTTWLDPVNTTGEFSIDDLPVNSDILIRVESVNGDFMDRVFYGRTTVVEQGQTATQSAGDLQVSEGVIKSYSVIDAETNEVFEGVVFEYNSSTSFSNGGNASGIADYTVTSSYDNQTELYTITIPKDLSVFLSADRDVDGDDVVDFTPQEYTFISGDRVSLSTYEALQLETMLVDVTSEYLPVELRVTIIDRSGASIPDIEFFASDQFLGPLEVSYDPGTEEYVFNYQSSGRVQLNMPSFETLDEVTYSSGLIDIRSSTNTSLVIYDSGFVNNLPNEVEVLDGVASVVLQARLAPSNSGSVSLVSSIVDDEDNHSLKQFYSAPIGLLEDSVSLNRTNVFTVIKGNESDSDLVSAGTTKIGYTSEPISVSTNLRHNDTFLTSSPDDVLSAGEFSYSVNELVNKESGQEFDARFGDSFEIEVPLEELPAFDINEVRLDNNNGTTNGLIIVSENTAGVPSTTTDNRSTVRIYLPTSIRTLDFFELDLESYVSNGVNINSSRNVRIVDETRIWVNERNLVSLSTNENIEAFSGSSSNADTNTALADGVWYLTTSTGLYLSDNTGTTANTATYRYIYRVAGDEAVTEGTITLPIL